MGCSCFFSIPERSIYTYRPSLTSNTAGFCSTGAWTQDLGYARQAMYNWAAFPTLIHFPSVLILICLIKLAFKKCLLYISLFKITYFSVCLRFGLAGHLGIVLNFTSSPECISAVNLLIPIFPYGKRKEPPVTSQVVSCL